jgi:hypothetical protein
MLLLMSFFYILCPAFCRQEETVKRLAWGVVARIKPAQMVALCASTAHIALRIGFSRSKSTVSERTSLRFQHLHNFALVHLAEHSNQGMDGAS